MTLQEMSAELGLETLPEDTSLQRSVKKLYLDGGYLHEGEGFFF